MALLLLHSQFIHFWSPNMLSDKSYLYPPAHFLKLKTGSVWWGGNKMVISLQSPLWRKLWRVIHFGIMEFPTYPKPLEWYYSTFISQIWFSKCIRHWNSHGWNAAVDEANFSVLLHVLLPVRQVIGGRSKRRNYYTFLKRLYGKRVTSTIILLGGYRNFWLKGRKTQVKLPPYIRSNYSK